VSWKLEAALSRNTIISGECSVIWGCCSEAHILAEVVAAVAAMIAGIAGNAWLESDTVTNSQTMICAPTFNDNAR
jgi:hypothetical protein